MQFNSFVFLLAFFPLFFAAYFLLNKWNITAGKLCLVVGSGFFYLYGGSAALAVTFFACAAINYIVVLLLQKVSAHRKLILICGILLDVGILFYFKYFNFFLSTISRLLQKDLPVFEILLPLGISFYLFQEIMFLVGVYRGELSDISLLDYLTYILYFPKLLMGPLAEPKELIAQFNDSSRKKIRWENLSYGLKSFSFGLFKKCVLADAFAGGVGWAFAQFDAATSMDWFLVMLCYTFEIYFDFSGYCDMAVGISTMLSIDLPINFDSPYKAVSIREFWKRWHVSLTRFLTRYLYIPLGGNQKGSVRTCINIMLVFLVSGLWHGANWTFILWGLLHGGLLVLERLFEKGQKKLIEAVRWMGTFFAVNLLWLLFRAESVSQWKTILVRMFTFQDLSVSQGLLDAFRLPEMDFFDQVLHLSILQDRIRGFSLLVFLLAAFVICLIPENNYRRLKTNGFVSMVFAAIAFIWGFLCVNGETTFVYYYF